MIQKRQPGRSPVLTPRCEPVNLRVVPMPEPESIIPSSEPVDFVTAISRARVPPGRARAVPAYKPSVSETEFKKRFPLPYQVQAVTIYEAARQGWATDRSYWQFLDPFRYVSPKWGPIEIPKGFYTDFASVPPALHSIIDDDSPIILFPSAPHDFLFTKRPSTALASFFVDRQVIVVWRAKRIEHACRQYRFHTMRNITREIEGIAD